MDLSASLGIHDTDMYIYTLIALVVYVHGNHTCDCMVFQNGMMASDSNENEPHFDFVRFTIDSTALYERRCCSIDGVAPDHVISLKLTSCLNHNFTEIQPCVPML